MIWYHLFIEVTRIELLITFGIFMIVNETAFKVIDVIFKDKKEK